jgi:predicted PurR-regulated permease PerM
MEELKSAEHQQLSFRKKVWIAVSITSLMFVFLFLFQILFSVLLLILAAVLIALYFYGVAAIFKRKLHCSPRIAIILSVIINLLVLAGTVWFVGARIQAQTAELAQTIPGTIEQVKEQIGNTAAGSMLLREFNSSGDSSKTLLIVKHFFSSSFGILGDLYIVALMAIFFIVTPSVYINGMVKLLPLKAKEKGADIINKIGDILKKWLKAQLFGMLFIGVLTAIGLMIIGMPMVLPLSIIAGLLNVIPNFGPLIALMPGVLIGLLQNTTTAIIIACMYTFIQIIQTAVSQPLLQKKMINISPALVIVGQVAFGLLAGFWGVLLATPLIAILTILVQELYIDRKIA